MFEQRVTILTRISLGFAQPCTERSRSKGQLHQRQPYLVGGVLLLEDGQALAQLGIRLFKPPQRAVSLAKHTVGLAHFHPAPQLQCPAQGFLSQQQCFVRLPCDHPQLGHMAQNLWQVHVGPDALKDVPAFLQIVPSLSNLALLQI